METLHLYLRWFHIAAGFFGLVLFWVPSLARKGSPLHLRAGRLFVYCVYAVLASAVSALALALYGAWSGPRALPPNQLAFAALLFYLALLTFAAVRHGVRVVETRRCPADIRTPFHLGLAGATIAASILIGGVGLGFDAPLLMIFSPLGALSGIGMIRYIRAPEAKHMGWFYEHMGAMIGAGIAFHTAFAVTGAHRLFDLPQSGLLSLVPWFLPAVVGSAANALLERRYRRRFARSAPARSGDPVDRPHTLETALG